MQYAGLASWLAQLWLSFHFENGYSCCYMLSDRDEFGASIDNSKEKLIDDDGMTKNNTESPASQPSLQCTTVQPTYKDSQDRRLRSLYCQTMRVLRSARYCPDITASLTIAQYSIIRNSFYFTWRFASDSQIFFRSKPLQWYNQIMNRHLNLSLSLKAINLIRQIFSLPQWQVCNIVQSAMRAVVLCRRVSDYIATTFTSKQSVESLQTFSPC